MPSKSSGVNRSAVSPSTCTSSIGASRGATTGICSPMNSNITTGEPNSFEWGKTAISARQRYRSTSLRGTAPVKTTCLLRPSSDARLRAAANTGPSPTTMSIVSGNLIMMRARADIRKSSLSHLSNQPATTMTSLPSIPS